MEVIEVKEEQKEIWNNFVKENGTLLQSWEWGEFKSKFSWQPFRLAVVEKAGKKANWAMTTSVLCKRLPFSKSFLYVPEGPIASPKIKSSLKILLSKIKEIAQRENAIFLRIEPLIPNSTNQPPTLRSESRHWQIVGTINQLTDLGFRKSFENIQPAHRLFIDLTKSEEELLKEMKHKGRYNIKLASQKGVNIQEMNDSKMLDTFYSLYLETAKRDKFSIRPKGYFKELLDIFRETGYGKMFIAFFKRQPLAAILVTFFGKYATYLYGATSSIHREMMASYLIQWEAIKMAKKEGLKVYDFGAIAPTEDPSHPWAGLRQFKMKFGGQQIDLPGSYDLVYRPFWYNLFKIAEKMRRKGGFD